MCSASTLQKSYFILVEPIIHTFTFSKSAWLDLVSVDLVNFGWRGFLLRNLLVKISQVEISWRSAKPCYQKCFWLVLSANRNDQKKVTGILRRPWLLVTNFHGESDPVNHCGSLVGGVFCCPPFCPPFLRRDHFFPRVFGSTRFHSLWKMNRTRC